MVQAVVIFFSIPRSEWAEEGPLFESDSKNAGGEVRPLFQLFPGPLLKSGPGPWPDIAIFHLTKNWNDLERGHYLSQTRINDGDQSAASIQIIRWTIIEVRPGALGQIWHPPREHKWET